MDWSSQAVGHPTNYAVIKACSNSFAQYLLDEARVAVVPGAAFGSDDHVRISYATSMDRLHEGVRRIEAALRKL